MMAVHKPNSVSLGIFLLLAAIAFLAGNRAEAASVLALDVRQLVRGADLIFHGVVTDIRVTGNGGPDSIVTQVDFRVLDVLKGPNRTNHTAQFMGGTYGGFTLSVPGMNLPAPGEEGVYFIEAIDRPQVNPIVGWAQGHFQVRYGDGGAKRVYTYSLEPVFDLRLDGVSAQETISHGTAHGVVTRAPDAAMAPLTLDAFKDKVRKLVESTR